MIRPLATLLRLSAALWLVLGAPLAASAVNFTNIVSVDFNAVTTNKIVDAGAGDVRKTNFYTFTVAGLGNVVDLNFRLSVLHSSVGDLDISLISPTNGQAPLTNVLAASVGNFGNNFQDTFFDQEGGSTRIDLGSPPFAGPEYTGGTRYTAQFSTDTLSKFKTINPNGTWTLKVVDQFFQDDGFLLWPGANPRALQKFLQDTNVGNVWGTNASGTNTLGTQLIFTVPCPTITGVVSGGGTICVGNSSIVTVTITNGAPPYIVTLNNGGGTKTNSSPLNFTVSPGSTTTYSITSATDSNGCPVTPSGSATVTVNANPATPTITTPASVCASSAGNQASGPDGATTYAWTIANGSITSATNLQTITYTAGASGNVTLNLAVANAAGCTAANSTNVSINANPSTPAIIASPSWLCANSTGNQASGPGGATGYAWTIGNGTITSATNVQAITYTAGASGSVTLNLTVANASGCTAFNSTNVPIPLDTTPPTINCPGNILVSRDASILSGPVAFSVTASDNCTASNLLTITSTPASGSDFPFGTTTVTNVARDAAGNTNSCTFTVTVNRIPVAGTDNLGTSVNTPVNVPATNLLANDVDGDGDPVALVSVSATSTNGGSVLLAAGSVTYTPTSNFFGVDRFLYTLADNRGGTNTGTVIVNVVHPFGYLLTVTNVANAYRLSFIGVPGQAYSFQYSTDLLSSWSNLFNLITAGASGLIITNDTNTPFPESKFYRIAR